MKTVIHIVASFNLGGSERVAANIAKNKDEAFKFHMVEVVRGHGEFTNQFIDELKKEGIHLHRSLIPIKKLAIILFPVRFLWILISCRPEVVHSHTEIPDLSLYLSYLHWRPFMANVRIVRTIHNTQLWNQWKWIGRIVEQRFFIKKNANVAISKSVQDCYYKNYGVVPEIIYNGIERPERWEFQHLRKSAINILFAGRLEPQKGIDTLVKVVKMYGNDNRYFFHIIGSGSQADYLTLEIKGISNVFFYGKVFALANYLSSFDYVFIPSEFEGLCLLSIEASLSKTPVIINYCLGLNETIPNDWKYVVHDNNLEEYKQIFDSLPHDTERQKLAEHANRFCSERFTIENMQKQYTQLYTALMGS